MSGEEKKKIGYTTGGAGVGQKAFRLSIVLCFGGFCFCCDANAMFMIETCAGVCFCVLFHFLASVRAGNGWR